MQTPPPREVGVPTKKVDDKNKFVKRQIGRTWAFWSIQVEDEARNACGIINKSPNHFRRLEEAARKNATVGNAADGTNNRQRFLRPCSLPGAGKPRNSVFDYYKPTLSTCVLSPSLSPRLYIPLPLGIPCPPPPFLAYHARTLSLRSSSTLLSTFSCSKRLCVSISSKRALIFSLSDCVSLSPSSSVGREFPWSSS